MFPLGEAWHYSGGGYSLLQLLVEDVTGESFAEYMRQNVLEPLGMSRSGFFVEPVADLVPVYDMEGTRQPARSFPALAAAGGYSTANDLARWLLTTVNDGDNSVFTAVTRNIMLQAEPGTQRSSTQQFGLGYALEFGDSYFIAGHDGVNLPGWRTRIVALPQHGAGLAFLSNHPNGEGLHQQLTCRWVTYITGQSTTPCLIDSILAVLPAVLLVGVLIIGAGVMWRR